MRLTRNPQTQRLLKGLLGQYTVGRRRIDLLALVDHFNKVGLGDRVQSWLSDAPNQPISARQVTKAVGIGAIDQAAAQAGIPPEQAAEDLAAILPEVISAASPDGTPPRALRQEEMDAVLGRIMAGPIRPGRAG
jgi:uncharacterized protein YidB (DUF937 family)